MNPLKVKLIGMALGYAGKKMDGKKTYAGAAGKILTGLGTLLGGVVALLGHVFPDQGIPEVSVEVAITAITGGFYMISSGIQGIGLAHKGEKAIAAAAAAVPIEQIQEAVASKLAEQEQFNAPADN